MSELRGLLGISSVTDADTIIGGAPGTTVRYEMESASTAYMPLNRDLVDTAAGAAVLDDDPNTEAPGLFASPLPVGTVPVVND